MAQLLQFDEAAARSLEAIYVTPDVAAQRCAVFRLLDPHRGERVIDIGCGTGLLAADLALAVGDTGRVVGVDISENVLALARRRCGDWPWTECRQGDATALPGSDGAFDVAVSTQVLEYVADVDLALAEIARILRPGGRVLVQDTDWDAFVLNADDAGRQADILRAWQAHAAHQTLPRSLSARLRAAGLPVVRRELLPMFVTSYGPHGFASGITALIATFVVKQGAFDEAEAQAWLDDLRAVDARGDFLLFLPRFLFLAIKPD